MPKPFEPLGSCLFHYTRLSAAVEHILPSWTLRMSPFAQMRDPRESRLLEVEGVGGWADPDWDIKEEIRHFTELNEVARDLKN